MFVFTRFFTFAVARIILIVCQTNNRGADHIIEVQTRFHYMRIASNQTV